MSLSGISERNFETLVHPIHPTLRSHFRLVFQTDQGTVKLHYPAVAMEGSHLDTKVDIRAGAHSDYGSLTLLFQRASQPGLEVLTGSDWLSVPVHPPGTENDSFPPVLVNIGDVSIFKRFAHQGLSFETQDLIKVDLCKDILRCSNVLSQEPS